MRGLIPPAGKGSRTACGALAIIPVAVERLRYLAARETPLAAEATCALVRNRGRLERLLVTQKSSLAHEFSSQGILVRR
jgi:hypothetical protein